MSLSHKLQSSLKYKIFLSLIIFILIPFLFLNLYFYSATESVLREKIIISTAKALKQTCLNVESIVTSMVTGSNVIARQSEVQQIISSPVTQDELSNMKHQLLIQDLFSRVQGNILPFNSDILLLAPDGVVYSSGLFDFQKARQLYETDWYKNTLNRKYFYNWYQLKESDLGLINNNDTELVVMSRAFEGVKAQDYAVLVVALEKAHIYEIMQSLISGKQESFFIAETSRNVVLASDGSDFSSQLEGRYREVFQNDQGNFSYSDGTQDFLVNYISVASLNWKIVVQSPHSFVFAEINRLSQQTLLMNLLFIVPFTFTILLLFNRFLRPISWLVSLMHTVEKGNLNQRAPIESNDELGMLTAHFNVMLEKLSRLIEENNLKQQRLADQQKEKEAMRYLVLKSQINPHFLFNTLNNIKWLAMVNHDKTVADGISNLGHLLEASIHNADDEITLRQELSYLDDYVHIMELSQPGKCRIIYHVDEQVLECKIAKLLLQPLVENAIIHGFQNTMENGEIHINGYHQGGCLMIEVIDNGVGFEDGVAESILARKLPLNKLGVNNTNQRIKLYYGEEYGLQILPQEPHGTRVVVTLPFHIEDANGGKDA